MKIELVKKMLRFTSIIFLDITKMQKSSLFSNCGVGYVG